MPDIIIRLSKISNSKTNKIQLYLQKSYQIEKTRNDYVEKISLNKTLEINFVK